MQIKSPIPSDQSPSLHLFRVDQEKVLFQVREEIVEHFGLCLRFWSQSVHQTGICQICQIC